MARHILFTSQKGGVGKSTLARSAAVALAYAGRKVLLADFDGDQRTCLRWQAQRQARQLKPEIVVAKFSRRRSSRVGHEYEDVVMDTRGQHDELSLDLAIASDVIFLPSSFSPDDVSPTLRVVEFAAQCRYSGVPRCRRVLPDRRFRAATAERALDHADEPDRGARRGAAAEGRLRFAVCHRSHRPGSRQCVLALDCGRDG